jgi:hypothetical protein
MKGTPLTETGGLSGQGIPFSHPAVFLDTTGILAHNDHQGVMP